MCFGCLSLLFHSVALHANVYLRVNKQTVLKLLPPVGLLLIDVTRTVIGVSCGGNCNKREYVAQLFVARYCTEK